jgi:hypothetical protein
MKEKMHGASSHRRLKVLSWVIFGFELILPWSLIATAENKPVLAILPFFIERVKDPGRGAVCPICKGVYRSGEVLPGSQNRLTGFLYEKMEVNGTFKIVPIKKMEEVLSHGERRGFEERPLYTSLKASRELNADFVLIGYLFRFEERIGSSIGVERPASVGFDLHLFRLRDEKMLWIGKFDEIQRPLSENLLKIKSFIRRKGSWLKAAELASVGMDEMLGKLPKMQELEQ